MRAAVGALVLALLLQGCTGIDDGTADGSAAVSAMVRLGVAEAIARDWDEDARLAAVVGTERQEPPARGDEEASDDDDPFEALWDEPDTRIGDGRAPAWLYAFSRSDGNGTLLIALAANGTLLERTELMEDEPEGFVREWRIDSDTAIEVARSNDDDWTVMTDEHSVLFVLAAGDDDEATQDVPTDPLWLIWLEDPDGEDLALSFVNATTGEYIGNFSGEFGFEFAVPWFVGAEYGEWDEEVTLVEPSDRLEFEVHQEGHAALIVRVGVEVGLPTTELALVVEGPDGVLAENTLSFANGGSGQIVWSFTPGEVGAYAVEVALTSGVAQSYYVQYCAVGFLIPFPDPSPSPFQRPHPCNQEDPENPSYSASRWPARSP